MANAMSIQIPQIPPSPLETFIASLTPATQQRLSPATAEVDPAQCRWYLLACIDGEEPILSKFGELGSLRERIMAAWPEAKMLNDDVAFYVFFGARAYITAGDRPCLTLPDGTLIPLYDPDDEVELIEDGYVNRREEPQVSAADEYADDDAVEEGLLSGWEDAEIDDIPHLGSDDQGNDDEPFPGEEVSDEEPD